MDILHDGILKVVGSHWVVYEWMPNDRAAFHTRDNFSIFEEKKIIFYQNLFSQVKKRKKNLSL